MANFACEPTALTCTKSENMGWRYLYIILGLLCGVMSIVRAVAIEVHESPKWLLTNGKVDEVVSAINTISRKNGSDFTLSADDIPDMDDCSARERTWTSICKLFGSAKLIRSMICLILLWAMIGIA